MKKQRELRWIRGGFEVAVSLRGSIYRSLSFAARQAAGISHCINKGCPGWRWSHVIEQWWDQSLNASVTHMELIVGV